MLFRGVDFHSNEQAIASVKMLSNPESGFEKQTMVQPQRIGVLSATYPPKHPAANVGITGKLDQINFLIIAFPE